MPVLVVTEKPSVAREIASVLGETGKGEGFIKAGDITFTWAVGHLLSLIEPHHYNPEWKKWDIELLPILPENFLLQPIDTNAKKQLSTIKKIYKSQKWDYVVNACDAGREGELIFAWVREYCKFTGPFKRLWLASLTKTAIKQAWNTLHDAEEYHNLENAARQRAEADWLVGLNATRAASVQLRGAFSGKQVLSLGRVQTPTLALIVRRENEIKNFVPQKYYNVDAYFQAEKGVYSGRLFLDNNEKLQKEYAEKASSLCKEQKGQITDLQKKEVKEQAPLLFDLTSLQREANNKLGFSAKRTLQAAQRLYETHKMLTYPRTDSRYLSTDMQPEIPGLLTKLKSYQPFESFVDVKPIFKRAINDKKVSDHHAIIPTGVVKAIEGDDAKLYKMVVQRFLACLYPDALVERTSIRTTVDAGGEKFIFRSRGRIILEAGWRALYGEEADEKSKEGELQDQSLPSVKQDEFVTVKDIKSVEKQTQPPAQFSDASLLGAMETAGKLVEDEELKEALKESGLGTPATRAAIIEGLIARGYVDRDGKKLVPTEKAVHLIDILGMHPLTSAELTGNWEKQLAQISTGNLATKEFQHGIRHFTEQTVEDFKKLSPQNVQRANVGKCPECGRDVIENRKGYSCWTKADPGCGFVIWKQHFEKTLTPEMMTELLDKKETQSIDGWKSGKDTFASRLQLVKKDEKWQLEFLDVPDWAKTSTKESVGKCPNCDRELWENRKGYSCWTKADPGCGFVVWKQQGKTLIDLEHFQELLQKGETTTDYGTVKLFKQKDGELFLSVNGLEKPAVNKKKKK